MAKAKGGRPTTTTNVAAGRNTKPTSNFRTGGNQSKKFKPSLPKGHDIHTGTPNPGSH
jgi:hypothetical protein